MNEPNFLNIFPGHKIYYINNDQIKELTVADIDKENNKIWIMMPGLAKCFNFDYSLSSNGFFYPSRSYAQMQLRMMKEQKESLNIYEQ